MPQRVTVNADTYHTTRLYVHTHPYAIQTYQVHTLLSAGHSMVELQSFTLDTESQ